MAKRVKSHKKDKYAIRISIKFSAEQSVFLDDGPEKTKAQKISNKYQAAFLIFA